MAALTMWVCSPAADDGIYADRDDIMKNYRPMLRWWRLGNDLGINLWTQHFCVKTYRAGIRADGPGCLSNGIFVSVIPDSKEKKEKRGIGWKRDKVISIAKISAIFTKLDIYQDIEWGNTTPVLDNRSSMKVNTPKLQLSGRLRLAPFVCPSYEM